MSQLTGRIFEPSGDAWLTDRFRRAGEVVVHLHVLLRHVKDA